MGMYDHINGEQVKCFYVPVNYYNSDDEHKKYNTIGHMGGLLRYYSVGDEVPYKTGYYNYGKNFMVIDIDEYDMDFGDMFHIILDGKVFDTYYDLDELPESVFNKIELFISRYYGMNVNINSIQDLKDFVVETKEVMKEIRNVLHENHKKEAAIFEVIKNKEASNEEKEKATNELVLLGKEQDKKIRSLRKNYDEKFLIEPNEKIFSFSNFGDIIDCLSDEDKKGNDNEENFEKHQRRLEHLAWLLEKFREDNPEFNIEEYFKWADMGQEYKSMVFDLCERYTN